MRKTVLHDLPDWKVTSYGGGTAYEVVNKRAARSVFFQGEGAED